MGEIERGMSARELNDWYRFCWHHPLPFELTDIHGGLLFALIANIHKAAKSPTVEATDFMVLRRKPAPQPPQPLTIAQQMKRVAEQR